MKKTVIKNEKKVFSCIEIVDHLIFQFQLLNVNNFQKKNLNIIHKFSKI